MRIKSPIKKRQSAALKRLLKEYPEEGDRYLANERAGKPADELPEFREGDRDGAAISQRRLHADVYDEINGGNSDFCTSRIYPEISYLLWTYSHKLRTDKRGPGVRNVISLNTPDDVVGLLDDLLATEGWTEANWHHIEHMWHYQDMYTKQRLGLPYSWPSDFAIPGAFAKKHPTKTIEDLRTYFREVATRLGGEAFLEWPLRYLKEEPCSAWADEPTAVFVMHLGAGTEPR
tara:strand:+ start:1320 stop:2015 length:696 start_codon:yes stop_codon:yes gene_type:complete